MADGRMRRIQADREVLHKTHAELVNRTRFLYYSA